MALVTWIQLGLMKVMARELLELKGAPNVPIRTNEACQPGAAA